MLSQLKSQLCKVQSEKQKRSVPNSNVIIIIKTEIIPALFKTIKMEMILN